jgi:hypothetical protein
MGQACGTYGRQNYIQGFGVETRELLGKPRSRREDNIKMNLQRSRMEGMDWLTLAQDRNRGQIGSLLNTVMNLRLQ